jgi:pSer/pThr/pTyr-binding forkhead associated (FHA) protein
VFVVDITFQGDANSTETVFVRRPYVTVGADESAHVVVSEMSNVGFSLGITRELGRQFKVSPVLVKGDAAPFFIGGIYQGTAQIDVGPCTVVVTALDLDLVLRENEAVDRAGVRILRRAFSDKVPDFPAVMITKPARALISFSPDQPLVIGRSRMSGVRLDLSTVSLQHARVGFESGSFWVEDLGSTNGTFVEDRQVSSRIAVSPGVPIHIGKHATIVGVVSAEQIAQLDHPQPRASASSAAVEPDKTYPCLISVSEAARPSRLALKRGQRVLIGRDPSCDLWLGAPHVSRRHCEVEVSKAGLVTVTDTSTNGTVYDGGLLREGESHQTSERAFVLDFGTGMTVAVCFSQEQEDRYQSAHGDATAFTEASHNGVGVSVGAAPRVPRERRTTTWFNVQAAGIQQADTGVRGSFSVMFGGLTPTGRVAMVLAGVGLVGLLGVLGSMLAAGLRW